MVDLDRGHRGAGRVQRERERSEARPDFEDLVPWTDCREPRDAVGEIRVDDEVLTERLRRSHPRRAQEIHRLAPPEPATNSATTAPTIARPAATLCPSTMAGTADGRRSRKSRCSGLAP